MRHLLLSSKGCCTCLCNKVGRKINERYPEHWKLGKVKVKCYTIRWLMVNILWKIKCFWVTQAIQGITRRYTWWWKKWATKNTKNRCKRLFRNAERITRIWRKRPKHWIDNWILHHENAIVHDALENFTKINRSLYWPDLTTWKIYLSKVMLK